MCYDVIKEITDVWYLAPLGGCRRPSGDEQSCPDIFGFYMQPGKERKGFVIDCKHYSPGRSIDEDDCRELNQDRDAFWEILPRHRIWKRDKVEIISLFVTSEGDAATARGEGYTVISVGRPGASHWKRKLEQGFLEAVL